MSTKVNVKPGKVYQEDVGTFSFYCTVRTETGVDFFKPDCSYTTQRIAEQAMIEYVNRFNHT